MKTLTCLPALKINFNVLECAVLLYSSIIFQLLNTLFRMKHACNTSKIISMKMENPMLTSAPCYASYASGCSSFILAFIIAETLKTIKIMMGKQRINNLVKVSQINLMDNQVDKYNKSKLNLKTLVEDSINIKFKKNLMFKEEIFEIVHTILPQKRFVFSL